MAYLSFISKKFSPSSLATIAQADEICNELAAQGYSLTLRQLYYQFVSRDLLPNNQSSYDRLGRLVSDGRLAGMIDWAHLQDRGRNVVGRPNAWDDPEDDALVRQLGDEYVLDLWSTQRNRIEVWVEKEALIDVVTRASEKYRVPAFACKGYVSQSEMFAAAVRFSRHRQNDQRPVILHLGDHDPSGIDMTRDIQDRLTLFLGRSAPRVHRIALTMTQIEAFNPPPNYAKQTDGRWADYVRRFDTEYSWELDALPPATIDSLITQEIEELIDWSAWTDRREEERQGESRFYTLADRWEDVKEFLGD